ncbi:MAG: VWA domain-containing protein [Terracidiphilus sp.]
MKFITGVFFALVTGFICIPIASSAQSAGVQNAPGSTQTAATNTAHGVPDSNQLGAISLDVLVTDKSGTPVTGLQAGDFKLLLGKKQPQNIVSVRAAGSTIAQNDPPAGAIVVVDAVNAWILTVNAERQMLARYFEENNGQLPIPVYLAIFTDQGMKVHTPATQDGKALEEFLNANTTDLHNVKRPDGWWGDMEREQLSLKTLNYLTSQVNSMPGRKLFIWLSPGWNLQTNGQWDGASKSDQQGLYDNTASVLTALRTARVTVYSIDPSGPAREMTFGPTYEAFLKGLDAPKHADYGYLLLQVLAIQTGGQALYASNDLSSLISKSFAETNSYYVLTFNPPPAAHLSEFNNIEVQVGKTHCRIPKIGPRQNLCHVRRPVAYSLRRSQRTLDLISAVHTRTELSGSSSPSRYLRRVVASIALRFSRDTSSLFMWSPWK